MNKSKDLIELFRTTIKNKHKRTFPYTSNYGGVSNPPPMSSVHRIPGTGYPTIGKGIKIYFYEWSDITSVPKQFNDLSEFENFLKTHGLYLQLYQRDLIIDLGTIYISCFRGRKELCVRGSYQYLLESMNRHDRIQTENEINRQGIPYNRGNGNMPGPVIRRPPIYAFESQTEMEQLDGSWFG